MVFPVAGPALVDPNVLRKFQFVKLTIPHYPGPAASEPPPCFIWPWSSCLDRTDHRLRLRSGMCLQQTDLGCEWPDDGVDDDLAAKTTAKSFVVSLFGARDDIKAHYSAERARVCGATWEAFLEYAGATAEDVWGGIDEADRKLWSVSFTLLIEN